MGSKEAARRSWNYGRAKSSGRAVQIIPDKGAFRLAALSVAFAAALYAVPTAMAALKAAGCW